MDDREIIKSLIDYFNPDISRNEKQFQYLTEHLDLYFDYDFIEELRDTLKWRVIERVDRARKDFPSSLLLTQDDIYELESENKDGITYFRLEKVF